MDFPYIGYILWVPNEARAFPVVTWYTSVYTRIKIFVQTADVESITIIIYYVIDGGAGSQMAIIKGHLFTVNFSLSCICRRLTWYLQTIQPIRMIYREQFSPCIFYFCAGALCHRTHLIIPSFHPTSVPVIPNFWNSSTFAPDYKKSPVSGNH